MWADLMRGNSLGSYLARCGTAMRSGDVLDAVKARLSGAGLSTRPWVLLDRAGPAIAYDDTDTLHPDGPWTWQAVERLIKAELGNLGLLGLATSHKPDTGVVRIAYSRR